MNSQLDLWNKLNEKNTLQEVQKYIKNVIEIRGFANQKIESEVADVFIVLCSVCNKLDIDLYKALKEKEEENVKRIWNKE